MKPPKQLLAIKRDLDGIIVRLIEGGVCDDYNFSIVDQDGPWTDLRFEGAEHVSLGMSDIDYADISIMSYLTRDATI